MPFIEDTLVYLFNTKQVDFLTLGKLFECYQFSKMVRRLKSLLTGQLPVRVLVLPVVDRLFEKHAFSQLCQYLNENWLINCNQSGIRQLHSAVTCLLKSTDDRYSGMDTRNLVGMVFVDLKKAFDTVDCQILGLTWWVSYLQNKAQYYRVNGVDSKRENIGVGGPHGSYLDPLLLLFYFNDSPRAIENSTTSKYTADMSL